MSDHTIECIQWLSLGLIIGMISAYYGFTNIHFYAAAFIGVTVTGLERWRLRRNRKLSGQQERSSPPSTV